MSFIRKKDGFTVLELLTVIAIIGVLAALIFPIAASARKKAKETQCINNMMQIYAAVKQFQLDERRYPEVLGGMAADANGVAINLRSNTGMLDGKAVSIFPEYLDGSTSILNCPSSDNNGSGIEFSSETPGVLDPLRRTIKNSAGEDVPVYLYPYSSYDFQWCNGINYPQDRPGETHYSLVRLDMTQDGVLDDKDVTRQLRWKNPPADTVITWCSYHRGGKSVNDGMRDIVLFLDGHTTRVQSKIMLDWLGTDPDKNDGWRVLPQK